MTPTPTDATEVVQAGGSLEFQGVPIDIPRTAEVPPRRASTPEYDDGDLGHAGPASETAPAPHWLARDWKPVTTHGDWLGVEPPSREWLLARDGRGALAAGVVGLLIAPGGRGKTMSLVDLALAVATGTSWLGAFDVVRPGRVALLLAEEDLAEVRRRLYYIARARGMSDSDRALAADRIVPLGLSGHDVSLVSGDRELVTATAMHAAITSLVSAEPWSLIIMDPLARFAPSAEGDNAVATRAIESLEQIARAARATVIVAHHTSKWSRRDPSQASGGSAARGVTGITDGARWVAELTGDGDDLSFELSKTNGPRHEPVRLVRDVDTGAIRAATGAEVSRHDDDRAASKVAADDQAVADLADKLLMALLRSPVPVLGQRALKELVSGRATTKTRAVARLQNERRISGGGSVPYQAVSPAVHEAAQ